MWNLALLALPTEQLDAARYFETSVQLGLSLFPILSLTHTLCVVGVEPGPASLAYGAAGRSPLLRDLRPPLVLFLFLSHTHTLHCRCETWPSIIAYGAAGSGPQLRDLRPSFELTLSTSLSYTHTLRILGVEPGPASLAYGTTGRSPLL